MAARNNLDAWWETTGRKLFKRELWMGVGSCRTHPTRNIFFPQKTDPKKNLLEARTVCADCPVWKNCLQFALDNYEHHGIWGGLAEKERRNVKSLTQVKKCNRCNLIGVFSQRTQLICDRCVNRKSPQRRRDGSASLSTSL